MKEAEPFFEFRHVVGFEETSLVGNVYFVNYLRWQGRCRELFVKAHAPEVIEELSDGLSLVTVKCSCEFFAEVHAFDEVIVHLRAGEVLQNRLSFTFDYWRETAGERELVARGEQQIASMHRQNGRLIPAALPTKLREAVLRYGA